tara:strand:+ start:282 stop:605 length:324 start_codon:yes stop_codon:yes gene_type:complete
LKYNEEQILKEVIEYISSTYNQHYSTDGKGLQAMDIFRNMEIDMNFSQANAIKYLMRYGKKQGRNERDLYKAIHYIVLLISSEREKNTGTTVGALFHPDDPNLYKKE